MPQNLLVKRVNRKCLSAFTLMSSSLKERVVNEPVPLSPDQQHAVLYTEKHLKIVAGAGAGKTETIARRLVYAMLSLGIKPENIVAFTFTDRAAQSLKERVYYTMEKLVGSEKESPLLSQLAKAYIGTIHGYAKRILEDRFN
ncbi:MAG: UvrD-helicase domain-containing protein, partial [Nitrososphaeria archaeon]